MPNLGVFHPQIIHFVVALFIVGAMFRLVSLTRWKASFFDPAARWLIVLAALASVAAVKSGMDAHGPAERIPGVRDAVVEHEEWGEHTRNLFLVIAALELGTLALGARPVRRVATAVTAAVVLVGVWSLYETAEHGGELVYAYAGGVGTRSGQPQDVTHLLVAGLYNQAQLDRREGRNEAAARLIDELAARLPDDLDAKYLRIESELLDRNDAQAAIVGLAAMEPPSADNVRLRIRHGFLLADAYSLAGHPDSALAVMTQLSGAYPENTRIRERLDALQAGR